MKKLVAWTDEIRADPSRRLPLDCIFFGATAASSLWVLAIALQTRTISVGYAGIFGALAILSLGAIRTDLRQISSKKVGSENTDLITKK